MSSVYVSEPPTKGKVIVTTTYGPLDIELWPKEAPKAVRNFVQLCLEGYYDNTIFHRIIKGFLVQGGDPTGSGTGTPPPYLYIVFGILVCFNFWNWVCFKWGWVTRMCFVDEKFGCGSLRFHWNIHYCVCQWENWRCGSLRFHWDNSYCLASVSLSMDSIASPIMVYLQCIRWGESCNLWLRLESSACQCYSIVSGVWFLKLVIILNFWIGSISYGVGWYFCVVNKGPGSRFRKVFHVWSI